MADVKISALAALTLPDVADFFPIVDVSDTSMAASGTDKKITVATVDARYAPLSQGKEILRGTSTSNGGSIATIQTIFTLTFTGVAGRRYRIRSQLQLAMGAVVGTVTLSVTDAGGTALQTSQTSATNTYVLAPYIEHEVVPGAGSITYLVRAVCSAACVTNGGATQLLWATVDDVGT